MHFNEDLLTTEALRELRIGTPVRVLPLKTKQLAAHAIPEGVPAFYKLEDAAAEGWHITGRTQWGYWLSRKPSEVAILILWTRV